MTTTAPRGAASASGTDLRELDAWWRAANYLAVGQIYLMDNPLLREPLVPAHIKPRLLGHWGTTPGLTFLWAHLNRVIVRDDLDALYVTGPGHGGPGVVATAYLEGTYTERYAHITDDAEGLQALFRQFSFPGGIPSHAAPETPGSIHEGGELGYALSHAYGAAFDNPDLLVACVIGDGEAETGPLAGSWQANKFLHPVNDGTVLPVLHLNGYKIANSTVMARIPQDELLRQLEGHGHRPYVVEGGFDGEDPMAVHERMASTLDEIVAEIARVRAHAKEQFDAEGRVDRPRWPMLVLRTPKGWTGPARGRRQARRGHVACASGAAVGDAHNDAHRAQLEEWLRSYRPGSCSTTTAGSSRRCAPLPAGARRMSATAHANGGELLRDLRLPDFTRYAVDVPEPGSGPVGATAVLGTWLRDVIRMNPDNFRIMAPTRPRRTGLQAVFEATTGSSSAIGGDRRGRRAGRPRHRGALGAPVPGLAGGLPAHRPARPVQLLRGVHPHRRLDVQPARQVARRLPRHPVAAPDRVADLPAHQPRLAPGPQRVLPPGPRLHRPCAQQEAADRPRLPAAGREHPAVDDGPLPAHPELRQRRGGREAAGAAVADDGRGGRALHPRPGHLGLGEQLRRRRTRRRARLRGRRARRWRPSRR